jgi:hypothetical protein
MCVSKVELNEVSSLKPFSIERIAEIKTRLEKTIIVKTWLKLYDL